MTVTSIPRWSQMLRSISLLLSGAAVARLFTALVLILIARRIGPEQFGQYTACFTVAWLAAPLFSLGLDNWLLGNGGRAGAEALTVHASTCLVLKACLGLIWVAGLVAIAPLLDADVFPPLIVVLAALTVWFDELARLVWAAFETALDNTTTLSLMVTTQALILLPILALFLLGEERATSYVVVQAAATATGALVSVTWQVRRLGFRLVRSRLAPTVKQAVPFALSMGLALIYGRADVAIVAQWVGKTAAGLYAPAVSLISALTLIPVAIYNVVLPVFSQAQSQDRDRLPRLVWQALLLTLLIGLAMAGAVLLLARPAVALLYGEAYARTASILMILSGVLVVRSINLGAAAALIALDLQTRRVRYQAAAAAFNIAATFIVIQRWGIGAVALVFVLTEAALAVGYLFIVWQSLRSDAGSVVVEPS